MVREIETYEELEAFLSKVPEDQLVVIDCFATWCGPCKRIAPFIDELSDKYENVIFVKGDVEKIEELSEEFNVNSMPTFIFIKDLTVIDKLEGASQSKLIKLVEKHI